MRVLIQAVLLLAVCVGVFALTLKALQLRAEHADEQAWDALAIAGAGRFDPAALPELPAAARAYLVHAIAPGTALARSVDLEVRGTLLTRAGGDWADFTANERLAPERGYVARIRVEADDLEGVERYDGGAGRIDYWRHGLLPASQESADLARSLRGRLALERVLLPTQLLPERGVRWEPIGDVAALARFAIDGEEIALRIDVGDDGRLLAARVDRFGDPEGRGSFALRSFGLRASAESTFDGVTIPTEFTLAWDVDRDEPLEYMRPRIARATLR